MYKFINNFIHDLSERKKIMYDDIFYFVKTESHYVTRKDINELAIHISDKYPDETVQSICIVNALTMNVIVPTMEELALLLNYGICNLDTVVHISEMKGIQLRNMKYYTEVPDPLDCRPLRPGIMTARPRGMYITIEEISLLSEPLRDLSDKEIESDILSYFTLKEGNKMDDKNSELNNEFEDSKNSQNTSTPPQAAVLFPKTEQLNSTAASMQASNRAGRPGPYIMPVNNSQNQYNQTMAGTPVQYNQSMTNVPNQYNQVLTGMSNQYSQYSAPNQQMNMYNQSYQQYPNQQSQYNMQYSNSQPQYNIQYPNQRRQFNQGNVSMSMPANAFQQSQYGNQQSQYMMNQQSQFVNAQSIYSQSTMEDNGDIYEMRKNKVLGVLSDSEHETAEDKKKSKGGFMGLFGKK